MTATPLRLALLVGLLGCVAVVAFWQTAARTATRRAEYERVEARQAVQRGLTPRTRAELTQALQQSQIERYGKLGVIVQPLEGGGAFTYGRLQEGRTWSVIKVPLVLAYLRWRAKTNGAADGSKTLTALERNEIVQTIRDSDNRSARHLYERMAARYGLSGADKRIERVFRDARETGIKIPKTGLHAFGTTVWRLRDAVDLFTALNDGELASAADTRYLLRLMRNISARDSWGLSRQYGGGSRVAFKGGWGSDSTGQWDLEQVGIVGGRNAGYVMAIMFHTTGHSGNGDAFAQGRSMFDAVAAIIAAQIPDTD